MKIISVIFFLLSSLCYSQIDTVSIDITTSSFSLKQIESIYLRNRSASYSISAMDSVDRDFYQNEDTIYIKILKGAKLLLEGKKLPKSYAIGQVIYYKKSNGSISRIENRTDGGYIMVDSTKIYFGMETGYIASLIKYQGNKAIKKVEYQLVLNDKGSVCTKKNKLKRLNESWVIKRTTFCRCNKLNSL